MSLHNGIKALTQLKSVGLKCEDLHAREEGGL